MVEWDIAEGRCPVCSKSIVIVRATGLLAPHNVRWNPPNALGVALPVKCAGGGRKPSPAD